MNKNIGLETLEKVYTHRGSFKENKIKKENDCILFKASNGMNFGKIIEKINHT